MADEITQAKTGDLIIGVKKMSREHLENFAEYVIRQRQTHINCAPGYLIGQEKSVWVRGYDDFGVKLMNLLSNPCELVNRLPNRQVGTLKAEENDR